MASKLGAIMDSKLLKGLNPGTVIGTTLTAGFGVMEYKSAREEGSGRTGAIARAVGESIMVDALGLPTYLTLGAVQGIPKLGVKTLEGLSQQARAMSQLSRNQPFQNAHFQDSQQAFTMRQAGMQLAKAAKYNVQQTMLGNEAQYLHI